MSERHTTVNLPRLAHGMMLSECETDHWYLGKDQVLYYYCGTNGTAYPVTDRGIDRE